MFNTKICVLLRQSERKHGFKQKAVAATSLSLGRRFCPCPFQPAEVASLTLVLPVGRKHSVSFQQADECQAALEGRVF